MTHVLVKCDKYWRLESLVTESAGRKTLLSMSLTKLTLVAGSTSNPLEGHNLGFHFGSKDHVCLTNMDLLEKLLPQWLHLMGMYEVVQLILLLVPKTNNMCLATLS